MNVQPQTVIETLVTHAICNPSISLNEKKNLILMGDSLIKWTQTVEDPAVQPPEEDVPIEEK